MKKVNSLIVPGSLITRKTAAGYLARIAAHLLSDLSIESSIVLSEIENRIVSAGFLTWEQVEEIEASAVA